MKKMLVVDTRLIAYLTFHRKEQFLKTVEYIVSYSQNYSPFNKIILAFDGFGGSYRRKNLYPGYKQHRRDREKKQTDAEQKRLKEFNGNYSNLSKLTDTFVTSLNINGIEADDLANVITDRFHNEYEIYLLSSDKDWVTNLISDNVKQIHLTKGLITKSNAFAVYGVLPEDEIFIQSLCGIAKENVKGVYRLGDKRVKKLLYEQSYSHKDVINQVQEWVNVNKYGMRLIEGFDTVQELYDFNYEILRKFTIDDFEDWQKEEFIRQFNDKKNIDMEYIDEVCLEYYGVPFMFNSDVYQFFKII